MEKKFRGVYPHKDGGFVARLGRTYLGIFREHSLAVEARCKAEVDQYGAVFDRREIEVIGDVARIPLHGRHGKFYGWALADAADLPILSPVAWTLDPRGYVVGRPEGHGNSITMHRLLMFGLIAKGGTTDHLSRDRLDNRRANLRKCTPAENSRNTCIAKNNTSGFKGVKKTAEGRWKARITRDYKEIHLGHFDTKEEAAAAYNAAALVLHMGFASTNDLATTYDAQ